MQKPELTCGINVISLTMMTLHFLPFRMVERFGDIAYMYKIDQITNFDEENFPSTITLSKVVRVWAHAARYYVKTML